jgi:hypothetical protein
MQRTATYLVMGHDSNEITLSLKDDRPHLQSGAEERLQNATHITQVIERVTNLMGGDMMFCYFSGWPDSCSSNNG